MRAKSRAGHWAAGAVVLTAGLSACAAAGGAPSGGCDAEGYGSLIGANIAAVTLPDDLSNRIVRPDSIVTQDYRPDRLNIHVDADGVIQRVRCG